MFRHYTSFMETVLRKNREGGVLHEFSYSWLKGVTLKPIPTSLKKEGWTFILTTIFLKQIVHSAHSIEKILNISVMWLKLLFVVFGLQKIVYRVRVLIFIFNMVGSGSAFAGSETNPVPSNVIERFHWYITRVIALFRLYQLLMFLYTEDKKKGKR